MPIKDFNEHQMIVTDKDGNDILLEILFTYENEERGKKYVFIYQRETPDEVLAFEYTDDGELLEIESDEEYEEVEEVFNAYNEEGLGEGDDEE